MPHFFTNHRCLLLIAILGLALMLPGQTTLFVDADASGGNDGTSWTNAYTDLQSALSAAVSGDEIWVAAGTYTPTSGSDRSVSFVMKSGVGLYGGFAGSETLRTQRDPVTNITVLSGDLNGDDDGFTHNDENSYHVVYANGVDSSAVLDGFTIRGGNANDLNNPHCWGGGIFSMSSTPTITQCVMSGNSALFGGGLCTISGQAAITDCTFSGNHASYNGGGLYTNSCNPTITNCTVSGNLADANGGGMYINSSSNPTIKHCTFSGNLADANGGGMYIIGLSRPIILCSILWDDDGNPEIAGDSSATIDTAIVRGGYAGTNIITDDPLLGPLADNGGPTPTHALLPGSPAIDAAVGSTEAMDQRGIARPQGPERDIGAYEYGALTGVFHVTPAGAGSRDGSSWSNAMGNDEFAYALPISAGGAEYWVAAGSYVPTSGSDRTISFVLKSGVGLYGGFAGTETLRTQRDPAANPTILSGDLNGDDGSNFSNNDENSYHVVWADGVNSSTVLDGFTIRGGKADGTFAHQFGGGMYNASGSPSISRCVFFGNSATTGGGFYIASGGPSISHSAFSGNSAMSGGGIYNDGGSTLISQSTFYSNSAGNGGAMFSANNDTIAHCTFSGNSATASGGALFFDSFNGFTVTHCTFTGNSAGDYGTGIYDMYGHVSNILHSIFWDDGGSSEIASSNSTVSTCIVRGGFAGGTNIITDDPLLGPLADNGGPTLTHALLPGSSAIDTATGSAETTDQRGVTRPQGPGRDIGAYEAEYHTVTFQAGPGGALSGASPQSIVDGGSASAVTAVPGAGYAFVNWTGAEFTTTTANPLTVTSVTADLTLTANFTPLQYTLTPSAGPGGSITPSTPQTVSHGGSSTFTISPEPGYHIADVRVDGSSVGAVGSFTFTSVSAGHTIAASFARDGHTITAVVVGGHGSADPIRQTVLPGRSAQVNFTPDPGYRLVSLSLDGRSVTPVSPYIIEDVQQSHHLTASFGNQPPVVTILEPFEGSTVLGRVTVRAQISDDDRIVSSELLVNGQPVALGQPPKAVAFPTLAGFIQTEDFCLALEKGPLHLEGNGQLRQMRADGKSVPVLSPDYKLRDFLTLPQRGWLLLAPDQTLRDTHGHPATLLLVDPARGWARGLLSDGFSPIPDSDGKVARLNPDSSLSFQRRDELSGRIDVLRWSEPTGQLLADLPDQDRPLEAAPVGKESSDSWVFVWDSDSTSAGPVTLTVRAVDTAGRAAEDSVGVKLARVNLSLAGERRMAHAWTIHRPYGYLEISAQGEETEIAALRLLRRIGEGEFTVLTRFGAEDLRQTPLIYLDKYLEKDRAYTYRLEALDDSGRTLGYSIDLTL